MPDWENEMMPFPMTPPGAPIENGPVDPVSVEFISPELPAVVSPVAAAIRDAVKDAAKAPVKAKVVAPYRVVYEGKPYVGGDVLELPADQANTWTKAGWITPVAKKGKK